MVIRESHAHAIRSPSRRATWSGAGPTPFGSHTGTRSGWPPSGITCIVFLAIFSSTFGFVAYTYLLLHETPSRLGTYAYVNPIVAVFTGWLLLGERLDLWQIAGSLVIFAGVILVRNLRLWPRAAKH
jgi:drug/metabolite transporter (DMT)-like permease